MWHTFQENAFYPSWSSDGGKIVFTSNLLNSDWKSDDASANGASTGFTLLKVMSNLPAYGQVESSSTTSTISAGDNIVSRACWSPDGKRIAYQLDEAGPDGFLAPAWVRSTYSKSQIYIMDAHGNNNVSLVDDNLNKFNPAWSPDGSKIAYSVMEFEDPNNIFSPKTTSIYVVNADGTNPAKLMGQEVEDPDMSCTWSPDGKKIAYSSGDDGNIKVESKIYVMNADGSEQTQLTEFEHFYDSEWVDTATQYIIDEGLEQNEDEVHDPDSFQGYDNAVLKAFEYEYDHSDKDPVWSPDGKSIAYISHRRYGKPVSSETDYEYSSAEKIPLSSRVTHLVVRDLETNRNKFYVIDPDESLKSMIHPHVLFGPTWAPDGTKIAVSIKNENEYLFREEMNDYEPSIIICDLARDESLTDNPTLYFPADIPLNFPWDS